MWREFAQTIFKPNTQKWILASLIALLSIYAVAVSGYIILGTLGPHGSIDFYEFWYDGHLILHGQDPYEAYLQRQVEPTTYYFRNGESLYLPITPPDPSGHNPTNTPLILVMTSVLALLPWTVVKILWMILNLALILLIMRVLLNRIPFAGITLKTSTQLLLLLVFYNLSATRIAVENGQTTLLVFFLMLAAWYFLDKSWLASGLLLGLALSKYSVAFPLVIFLLFKREYRALIVAGLVQLAGALVLSAISGNSLLQMGQDYIYGNTFLLKASQTGVNLSYLMERLHLESLAYPAVALMTAVVLGELIYWWIKEKPYLQEHVDILDLHLLTVLTFWALLLAYHALYDTLVVILFITLIVKGLQIPNLWRLSKSAKLWLGTAIVISLIIMTVPAKLVDLITPGYYAIYECILSVILITLLAVSMILFKRFIDN